MKITFTLEEVKDMVQSHLSEVSPIKGYAVTGVELDGYGSARTLTVSLEPVVEVRRGEPEVADGR
jgi:hypothetical protein